MQKSIELLNPTGLVTLEHFDKFGNLVEKRTIKNLIVSAGDNWIAARMKDTGQPTQMTHMAIGTGTAAPAAGDTALGTQLYNRIGLGTVGGTVSSNTVTYTATFATGYAGAVTEAGIFNASTAGTMLCRTTFAVINKADGDTLAITWQVTLS